MMASQPQKRSLSYSIKLYFILLLALAAIVIWPLTQFIVYTAVPLVNYFQAKSWTPTACTVISGKVDLVKKANSLFSRSYDKTTNQRFDIKYQYEFNGKKYIGNRYHFVPLYSTGNQFDNINEFFVTHYEVNTNERFSFTPNKQITCYANPSKPSESVINRSMSMMYFDPIGSMLFLIVFIFVAAYCFKYKNKLKEYAAQTSTSTSSTTTEDPLKKIATSFFDPAVDAKYSMFRTVLNLIYCLLILVLLIYVGLIALNEKMHSTSNRENSSTQRPI